MNQLVAVQIQRMRMWRRVAAEDASYGVVDGAGLAAFPLLGLLYLIFSSSLYNAFSFFLLSTL